jgi:peptide/nickel transport system permease protein
LAPPYTGQVATYAAKRLLWAGMLLLVLSLVTYIIFFIIPTDAVRTVPGRSSTGTGFRETANLEGTAFEEYWEFVYRLVTEGALGTSFFSKRSVNSIIGEAAPVTLSLVIGGALIWMLIAIPVGIVSALRPRSLFDRAGMIFVLFGLSAHPVWIGLVFSYVFGFKLGWFPISGYCDFFNPSTQCGGPSQWVYHMVLPWLSFALLFAAFYARMIRATVTEELHEDYVRTARAKGASEWTVVRSHVLRVAMLPLVALLALDIGGLALGILGSSLFIETAYGLPGLGKVTMTALQRHDLPIVAGVVLFVAVCVVVANLVADLVYAVLDPRIKFRAAQP